MQISLGKKIIGDDAPVFIIAEAGVNHNGKLDLAMKLVDAAVASGADAIKFQVFNTDELVTETAEQAEYQVNNLGYRESQKAMLQRLELSSADFFKLRDYCQSKKIEFLATPFDHDSINLLIKLNVPGFKIGSGELTNLPFIKKIAQENLPVIISTGMAYLDEVAEAVEIIKETGNQKIILLHCTSSYPAPPLSINLRAIQTLKDKFLLPVGFSDHTIGDEIASAAVALGACVIEKHLTLDKAMEGPDHLASMTPDEFSNMVDKIRMIEAAMGDGNKIPTAAEENTRQVARRSLVAKIDIPKGSVIEESFIAVKRPGSGLAPKYISKITGKTAVCDIKKDEQFTLEKVR